MLLSVGSRAQGNIRFRHFGKKDGLSQNSVFAIAQDSRGVMWFGTREGLTEYDGYRFKIHLHQANKSNSIPSDDVRALAYDFFRHCLWIGTMEGLGRFDFASGTFSAYTTGSGIGKSAIAHILVDSLKRVWVGTANGLHVLEDGAADFKNVGFTQQNRPDVKVIFEDSQAIWIGSEEGLFLFPKKQSITGPPQDIRQVFPELAPLSHLQLRTINQRTPQEYWFGTQADGIWRWRSDTRALSAFRSRKEDPTSLSHDNIRSVAVSADGTLWVGTFLGLNRFLPEQEGFLRILSNDFNPEGLRNSSVRSIFLDSRDNLWVGTYYGGLHYLNEEFSRFQVFKHQFGVNSLSFDVVSSFAEAPNGDLWIGTEGGGLNFWEKQTGTFRFYQSLFGSQGDNVKSLLLDGETLYMGTFQHGLFIFNTEQGEVRHLTAQPNSPYALANENVYALLKAGDTLWIGTYGGGLDILDEKTGKIVHYQHEADNLRSLSSDRVRTLTRDSLGHLWVGTDDGLNRVIPGANGRLEFEHFLPDTKVYVTHLSASRIWAGSLGQGLFQLDPHTGAVTQYTTQQGLPANSILGILTDAAGFLWLSTSNGISRFDPQSGIFTNYSHTDGLENLEFNYNAYYQTKSGDILFGGTHGFTRFNPDQLQRRRDAPRVILTGLTAFNQDIQVGGTDKLLKKPLNETEEIVFRYGDANFTLHFAAIDFTNPLGNRYAYRMVGLNNDWTHTTGKPEATYTLQQEGTYIFELKASNKDGVWNPEIKQLRIKVLPPITRTWWAYLAYAILLSLGTAAIIRFARLRQSYKLEQLEKQQQAAMHQLKLQFFTNVAHEFRTPLTLIIGPLEDLIQHWRKDQDSSARQRLNIIYNNAQRMLDLVNQLLTFRKMEEGHEPMQVEATDLSSFLKTISESFADHAAMRQIQYTLQGAGHPVTVWIDREKMSKVFFNLLSNAFKFTPDGGEIRVLIRQTKATIFVDVKDNGVGIEPGLHQQVFQRFYEKSVHPKTASQIKGMGIGLALSRQLVQLHHGQLTLESQSGQGATFSVALPQGNQHFSTEELSATDKELTTPLLEPVYAIAAAQEDNVPVQKKTNLPLLLTVEDNPEVQAYIRSIFADQYRIITAGDGKDGVAKAQEHNPDLILSDVMMPKMDGFELCQQLKTNLATSHIPIILLTARTTLNDRLEGLETGADDYISKPFHPDELRLKVRNTLLQRQRIRERFGQSRHFEPKDVAVTSADEEFLTKLIELIEANIGNPHFNIEQFAQELAVSRALLFTKIKTLTDHTPKNFLKSFRLKRAAQLLSTGKLNVSEVAYQVGFNEPKYFSRVFQQEFGVPPSQYAEA